MTALKQQTKSSSCQQGRLRRPKPAGALFVFLVELAKRIRGRGTRRGSVVWHFRPVRVVVPSCVLHWEVVARHWIILLRAKTRRGRQAFPAHLAGYLAAF